MPEEKKEMWTTQIRKGDDSDFNQRRARKITEVYDDISQYTPKYLPAGSMGYDSKTQLYTQTKPIKVRNSDGSFTVYDVPEFAVKDVYIPQIKPKVEPIANLVTQNQQSTIPVQQQPVQSNVAAKVQNAKPAQVSTTTKPKHIVKQPVPQNLLPYIANVSSDGVAFFNIPDGYTNDQFEEAVKAVYRQNNGLAQKPMVYYEQPQQQVQQQKQQRQAAQQSQKQYQAKRQQIAQQSQAQKQQATQGQNIKYNTNNNTRTVKVPVQGVDEPDLVTEVFAYPNRTVDVYNIHSEAYQKVLEYLNNNFKKTKTNNKPERYVLSLSGFDKVPIGGEVNDSIFHYIGKDGEHESVNRWYFQNANIIKKNEPFLLPVYNDVITDNGKLKMYSYSNGNDVYFKNSNGVLIYHPFKQNKQKSVFDFYTDLDKDQISYLREHGFNEQQIKDFINKNKNIMITDDYNNVDKSIFRPVEKEQPTQSNLTQQTSNSGNVVQKVKQTVKQTASKIRSFLGFQNGGQLKYYNNGKQIRIK